MATCTVSSPLPLPPSVLQFERAGALPAAAFISAATFDASKLRSVTFTVAVRGALKYAVSPNDVSALLLS